MLRYRDGMAEAHQEGPMESEAKFGQRGRKAINVSSTIGHWYSTGMSTKYKVMLYDHRQRKYDIGQSMSLEDVKLVENRKIMTACQLP